MTKEVYEHSDKSIILNLWKTISRKWYRSAADQESLHCAS